MTSWAQKVRQVRARARERCEYCLMHQSLQGATFHVDHVLPEAQGGTSELENLVLACPGCNLRKSDRVGALDPETGPLVPFFHLRSMNWADHFAFMGHQVLGKSATGRAVIVALDLNHPRRLIIRNMEERFDLFPPEV
jgi:hypothetical protein